MGLGLGFGLGLGLGLGSEASGGWIRSVMSWICATDCLLMGLKAKVTSAMWSLEGHIPPGVSTPRGASAVAI